MAAKSTRSGSYPIQSQDYTPHPEPGPPTVEQETTFPRSIRALRNADEADDHGRTLVICLDGTGDQFDHDNSNVVNFVSCLRKHTLGKQVTYYQSGIGTYDKGGLKNGIGAAADMAVGSGLGIHIKDAYRFLMQNYREGDKICLLGFSRGAYTVRCLAGMLHKVGLLPAGNGAQINFAYKFFKDDSPEGWKMSAEFKKTFCTNVDVYFVGLWDCVASVGFIPRKLPFSKSPTNSIHYFRHAMALDEHRSKFKVCQWQHQDPNLKRSATVDLTPKAQVKRGMKKSFQLFGVGKTKQSKNDGHVANGTVNLNEVNGVGGEGTEEKDHFDGGVSEDYKGMTRKDIEQEKLERYFEALDATRRKHHAVKTDVLEVWFMGCHADVGGGAVKNEERHKLSNIPLRWMIRQCFECNTGILFDTAALADHGLDMHSLWPKYVPPQEPTMEPAPSTIDMYNKSALAPLNRRSALLRIGTYHRRADEEDFSAFREAHQSALLPESTEDYFDARAPINDQLKQAKGWWVLEFWPIKVRVLAKCGLGWEKKVRMNLGRYRSVREKSPKLHWTVQHMVAEGRYKIKPRTAHDCVWEKYV
ncbi:uncharacterized protein PV09_03191 [Verruconis gallopava]|uniref:T6SS Phospholipase effector Tle1-like catalytic domain-containing protein n=1 Tax=Verruconis gallopava TaxID=253628 RepID=A0A0D2AHK7_9PEZI|nr:uncharacterized protein PV09_03191 [Verruconis gallopava]KIW06010.1 hypothetical protein PV09_03191 [Verruconis gallopava]